MRSTKRAGGCWRRQGPRFPHTWSWEQSEWERGFSKWTYCSLGHGCEWRRYRKGMGGAVVWYPCGAEFASLFSGLAVCLVGGSRPRRGGSGCSPSWKGRAGLLPLQRPSNRQQPTCWGEIKSEEGLAYSTDIHAGTGLLPPSLDHCALEGSPVELRVSPEMQVARGIGTCTMHCLPTHPHQSLLLTVHPLSLSATEFLKLSLIFLIQSHGGQLPWKATATSTVPALSD